MQGTVCFPAFVCSVVLCVGQVSCHLPLLKFTSSKNSLCSCYSLSSFFCFFLLFLSFTEVEFLVTEKRLFNVHVLHQKHFLSSMFNWSGPSNQENTGISGKFLFPSARNNMKTYSLCPSLSSILSRGWLKEQRFHWIHQQYPGLPSAVLDATCSPPAQAAVWSYLNRSYWHPLILLWNTWSACRYLEHSAHADCGCTGRVFHQMGIFRAVFPALPYRAIPSLGLLRAWANTRYVSPSFCPRPQWGADKVVSLCRSTLETNIWVALS